VDSGKSVYDVLNLIASAGYARPRQSELWGVLLDKNRSEDTPVQVFSPKTLRTFHWDRAFNVTATGFKVSFLNKDLDYKADEIVVYDPDVPPGLLEAMRNDGHVTEAEVHKRALFDLRQLRKRFTFYYGEINRSYIQVRRGDLVAVQHDSLFEKAGFARVKSVQTAAGDVTGVTLTNSIPIPTGDFFTTPTDFFTPSHTFFANYRAGVAIRLLDKSIITKEVVGDAEDAKILTFVVPFTIPPGSVLASDCHLVGGRLGSEYKRMLVFDIVPKGDTSAQITFVDEAPEIFLPDVDWTPSNLGDSVIAWYSANTGVYSDAGVTQALDNDPVAQWNDRSENGYNLSQATGSKRFAFKALGPDSIPAILMDAADDEEMSTVTDAVDIDSGIVYVYFIGQMDTGTASNGRVISFIGTGQSIDNDDNTSFRLGRDGSTNALLGECNTPVVVTRTISLATTVRVGMLIKNGAALTLMVDFSGVGSPTGVSASAFTTGTLTIGGTTASTQNWSGHIYEILLVDRELTAIELESLEEYGRRLLGLGEL